jgi:hypothetical protein
MHDPLTSDCTFEQPLESRWNAVPGSGGKAQSRFSSRRSGEILEASFTLVSDDDDTL